jgi:hypothetical protein
MKRNLFSEFNARYNLPPTLRAAPVRKENDWQRRIVRGFWR